MKLITYTKEISQVTRLFKGNSVEQTFLFIKSLSLINDILTKMGHFSKIRASVGALFG